MDEPKIYVARDPLDKVKRDETWWEKIGTEFIGLPYFPFFSNCRGYGKHIFTSKFLEDHPTPHCTRASPQNRTGYINEWPWNEKMKPQADECKLSVSDMDKYYPNWEWTVDDEGIRSVWSPSNSTRKITMNTRGLFFLARMKRISSSQQLNPGGLKLRPARHCSIYQDDQ